MPSGRSLTTNTGQPQVQQDSMICTPMESADSRAGNLFDYVKWRGDIPMSVDPFNEVDNLVLSTLVYSPFDGLVPGEDIKETITINELNRLFWEKHDEASLRTWNPSIGYAPYLLKRLSGSRRFGNAQVCAFVSELDDEDQYQFAAVTFLLEDGTCYAAFRGTDDSIAGWREDFNLSYMSMTRGQERAVEYLNRKFSGSSPFIRAGGHSKGGNLAVYGCMYCVQDVQERIKEIYTNDGPGFIRTITGSDDYKRILPKIRKYTPEESIVGIILDSGAEAKLIKSSADGFLQHNPFSWQISRNRFIPAKKRSGGTVFLDKTLNSWVTSLDPDNRKVFIDVLFDAIQSSGAKTITEFTDDPMRAYNAFYKTLKALPQDRRATLLLVLQKLAETGTNQLVEGLLDKLSSLAQKLNN